MPPKRCLRLENTGLKYIPQNELSISLDNAHMPYSFNYKVLIYVLLFLFFRGTILGVTTRLLLDLDLEEGVRINFEQSIRGFEKMPYFVHL
jgi:hypothetical protein